jgi:hypothetical protein
MIDHHGAGGGISLDRLNRTDIGAVWIGALVADRGKMIEILTTVLDPEQCPVRIVAAQQTHAAGQLAEAASGTQVKIGFDEKSVVHLVSRARSCPGTSLDVGLE